MTRLFKLQFLGPLALFVATLSAELAARALEYAPSSELLWFINLRMFGIFQRSDALLSYVVAVNGFQLFGIALPIFALACFGLATKSRPPLAIATHLSAAYAAFLVLSWQTGTPITQASLGPIAVPSGAGFYVLAGILGACALSSALSHLLYLRAVRVEFWMGGGTVKILTVAFLWTGLSGALPFALLALFSSIHAVAAKLGWAKSQLTESGRRRIPFAPTVAAALIGTFVLRAMQLA